MNQNEEYPKGILILNEIKAKSAKWEKVYDPDGDFKILSINELKTLPIQFDSGKPKIGQIYIQHPFQSQIYINPSVTPGEFERIKLKQLAQLSAILGAKQFTSILINRETTEKSKSGQITASTYINEIKVGAQNDIGQIISNSFELKIKFDGFVPQYQEALDYAIQSGLSKDREIWEFIQKRNPTYKNLANTYSEEINLSKEINENLEIGASVKAFAGKLNIEAKYSSREKKDQIVQLKILVEF